MCGEHLQAIEPPKQKLKAFHFIIFSNLASLQKLINKVKLHAGRIDRIDFHFKYTADESRFVWKKKQV